MVINLSVRQEAAQLAGRLSSDEVLGPVLGPDGCLRSAWMDETLATSHGVLGRSSSGRKAAQGAAGGVSAPFGHFVF